MARIGILVSPVPLIETASSELTHLAVGVSPGLQFGLVKMAAQHEIHMPR
jgi:hypothetical protein